MAEAPTSGPRPLQLASRTTIDSSTISPPCRNACPPWVQTQTNVPQCEDSHEIPSLHTQSRTTNRRQSSISYIHSGTSSPFQASFRPKSMEVDEKSHPTFSQFPPLESRASLSCNTTLSEPVARNVKDRRASKRISNVSLLGDSKIMVAMKHLKERTPVTVAEKHAALLHVIAQKESKCLELRSQLSIHEAELLQLKRKWELIVNRDKSQTSSSPSPNTSSTLSPSSSLFTPSASLAPFVVNPQTVSLSYFPMLPGAHTPVLEGLKDGVQGMSRLIAVGLESIAGGTTESSPVPRRTGGSSHQPPLSLRLGSVSNLDRKPRHGQNESQSSSSTAASMSTFASESLTATNTSATSIRSSFSFDGSESSPQINNAEKDGREGGEICDERSKTSTPASDRSEQVLIVRDTGATPTMSPNPDFERKRRLNKLKDRRGVLTGSPIKKHTTTEGFDSWLDDGWDEQSPSLRKDQPVLEACAIGQRSMSASEASTTIPPSLPPLSTPGIGTMNLAGPAAQQMSSWMDTVGKKLNEIRGSSTFTKGQKRASLLLQNTFVSSLISPTSITSSSSASATQGVLASDSLVSQPTSTSLLDEFDGEVEGNTNPTLLNTPVLVPLTRETPVLCKKISQSSLAMEECGNRARSESDDDWNW